MSLSQNRVGRLIFCTSDIIRNYNESDTGESFYDILSVYGCTTNTTTEILTPVMVQYISDTGDSGKITRRNEKQRENHGMSFARPSRPAHCRTCVSIDSPQTVSVGRIVGTRNSTVTSPSEFYTPKSDPTVILNRPSTSSFCFEYSGNPVVDPQVSFYQRISRRTIDIPDDAIIVRKPPVSDTNVQKISFTDKSEIICTPSIKMSDVLSVPPNVVTPVLSVSKRCVSPSFASTSQFCCDNRGDNVVCEKESFTQHLSREYRHISHDTISEKNIPVSDTSVHHTLPTIVRHYDDHRLRTTGTIIASRGQGIHINCFLCSRKDSKSQH